MRQSVGYGPQTKYLVGPLPDTLKLRRDRARGLPGIMPSCLVLFVTTFPLPKVVFNPEKSWFQIHVIDKNIEESEEIANAIGLTKTRCEMMLIMIIPVMRVMGLT